MSRFIGAFLAILTLGVTTFLLLWLFGVIEPNLWAIGKIIIAGGIIFGAAIMLTVIYGMFFWKGNEGPKPGSQKTAKSEFIGDRYSDKN